MISAKISRQGQALTAALRRLSSVTVVGEVTVEAAGNPGGEERDRRLVRKHTGR